MRRRFEPAEKLIAPGSFDREIAENSENVFQALSKETFASDGLGRLARRPQMATPGKAEKESKRQKGKELLELSGIGHVGVFGSHDSEDFLKELDSLFGIGVAAFGGLRKDSPGNGDGDLICYYANRKRERDLESFPRYAPYS